MEDKEKEVNQVQLVLQAQLVHRDLVDKEEIVVYQGQQGHLEEQVNLEREEILVVLDNREKLVK